MARAPPNAPSIPFRRRSRFWRPLPPAPRRSLNGNLEEALRANSWRPLAWIGGSRGLDIIAQRLLFALVFLDAPFDDVADRDQADDPISLDHRQMPELARRHHLHERGNGVGLPAGDHLARHHRMNRFVEHRSAAFA